MKFFETLREYRDVINQLTVLVSRENEIREIYGLKAQKLDSMPQPKNLPGDENVVNIIIKLQDIAKKRNDMEISRECLRNDLDRFLDSIVENRIRKVVAEKIFSVERLKWKDLAKRTMYSEPSVKLFYREGIKKLEGIDL